MNVLVFFLHNTADSKNMKHIHAHNMFSLNLLFLLFLMGKLMMVQSRLSN